MWHSSGMAPYQALANFLEETAMRAGEHILSLRESREVEIKADGSPVTRADKEAEALIITELQTRFAEIDIISEETARATRQRLRIVFFLSMRWTERDRLFVKRESPSR